MHGYSANFENFRLAKNETKEMVSAESMAHVSVSDEVSDELETDIGRCHL